MTITTASLEMFLTDSDRRIRRWWLGFFIVGLFLAIGKFCSLIYQVADTHLLLNSFVRVVCMYLLYLCAYKHPGIIYLTIILILGALLSAGKMWIFIAKPGREFGHPLFLALGIFVASLYICWYVLGWKLRSINKRIVRMHKRASETEVGINS